MKKKQVLDAYAVLNRAKLTQMDDADKFAVIKAMRVLRPVANSYDEYRKDAEERLKGEEHEEISRLQEELLKKYPTGNIVKPTKEELDTISRANAYFADYHRRVSDCLKEELDAEPALDYPHLSEEAFGKLVASNPDLPVSEIMLLEELLVAE